MERKRYLKKWVRFSLLSIIIGSFLISSLYIIYVLVKSNNKRKIPIYSYNINKNINYTVNLYENSFINDNKQGENKTYISDLVKNIDVYFTYNYKADKITNLKYNYSIIGELKAIYLSDSSNKEVWNKEVKYKNNISKEIIQKDNFDITDNITINYPELKKEVDQFKRQFNMNVSFNMDVYMTIKITGLYNGNKIEYNDKILLQIPYGSQAFSIEKKYDSVYNGTILDNLGIVNQFNIKSILTPISILIISVLSFLILYKPIFNIRKKNKYNLKLNKILRNFGNVVSELDKKVNDRGYEVVFVKSISDLISIQEELHLPVVFYEIRPNYLGEFIIIQNNIMYKYILKND